MPRNYRLWLRVILVTIFISEILSCKAEVYEQRAQAAEVSLQALTPISSSYKALDASELKSSSVNPNLRCLPSPRPESFSRVAAGTAACPTNAHRDGVACESCALDYGFYKTPAGNCVFNPCVSTDSCYSADTSDCFTGSLNGGLALRNTSCAGPLLNDCLTSGAPFCNQEVCHLKPQVADDLNSPLIAICDACAVGGKVGAHCEYCLGDYLASAVNSAKFDGTWLNAAANCFAASGCSGHGTANLTTASSDLGSNGLYNLQTKVNSGVGLGFRNYCDCEDSYLGVFCEQCLNGSLYEVTSSSGFICKRETCTASLGSSSGVLCNPGISCNNHGTANALRSVTLGSSSFLGGQEVNCTCNRGYAGRYCEKCAPGYLRTSSLAAGVTGLVCSALTCGKGAACLTSASLDFPLITSGACNGRGTANSGSTGGDSGLDTDCVCNSGYVGRFCESCQKDYLAESVYTGAPVAPYNYYGIGLNCADASARVYASDTDTVGTMLVCSGRGSANNFLFRPVAVDGDNTAKLYTGGVDVACNCVTTGYTLNSHNQAYYNGKYCQYVPMRAFVTVDKYRGDLSINGSTPNNEPGRSLIFDPTLGRARGGDGLCQDQARSHGLSGQWRAWLSDGAGTLPPRPLTGIIRNQKSKIVTCSYANSLDKPVPFLVANSLEEVAKVGGSLLRPLNMKFNGLLLNGNEDSFSNFAVWTNTDKWGTALGAACNNWTSTAGDLVGIYGFATTVGLTSGWTYRGQSDCHQEAYLYCFENIPECGYGKYWAGKEKGCLLASSGQQLDICNYGGNICLAQATLDAGTLKVAKEQEVVCVPNALDITATGYVCSGGIQALGVNSGHLCPRGQNGANCQYCDRQNHYEMADSQHLACTCMAGYTVYTGDNPPYTCNHCAPGFLANGLSGATLSCQGATCGGDELNPLFCKDVFPGESSQVFCNLHGVANTPLTSDSLFKENPLNAGKSIGERQFCDCVPGYAGPYCDKCAPGYLAETLTPLLGLTSGIVTRCLSAFNNAGLSCNGHGIANSGKLGALQLLSTSLATDALVNSGVMIGLRTACDCLDNYSGRYCQYAPLRAFVTAKTYSGNFARLGYAVGADALCQEAAAGAGLNGRWVALVGDTVDQRAPSLSNVARRVPNQLSKIVSLYNGELVANNLADILPVSRGLAKSASFQQPLKQTEIRVGDGATLTSGDFIWTGLTSSGSLASDNCHNWSAEALDQLGMVGQYAGTGVRDYTLIAKQTLACHEKAHLYCVENRAPCGYSQMDIDVNGVLVGANNSVACVLPDISRQRATSICDYPVNPCWHTNCVIGNDLASYTCLAKPTAQGTLGQIGTGGALGSNYALCDPSIHTLVPAGGGTGCICALGYQPVLQTLATGDRLTCDHCVAGYLSNGAPGSEVICSDTTCGAYAPPTFAGYNLNGLACQDFLDGDNHPRAACNGHGTANSSAVTLNPLNLGFPAGERKFCDCYPGYAGPFCEYCAPGYLAAYQLPGDLTSNYPYALANSGGVVRACLPAPLANGLDCYGQGTANFKTSLQTNQLSLLISDTDSLGNQGIPLGYRTACDCYGALTPELMLTGEVAPVALFRKYYSGDYCQYEPLRTFVSSLSYSGNFGGVLHNTGSLALGADGLCQKLAENAAKQILGGTDPALVPALSSGRWTAWLSTLTQAAADRLPNRQGKLINFTQTVAGGLPTAPILIAENLDALLQMGKLTNPLLANEYGEKLESGFLTWTGTSSGGVAGAANCDSWTKNSNSYTAIVGSSGLAANSEHLWTNAGAANCNEEHHLYCIENKAPCGYGKKWTGLSCEVDPLTPSPYGICNYGGDPCLKAGQNVCTPDVSPGLSTSYHCQQKNSLNTACIIGQTGKNCEFCDLDNHFLADYPNNPLNCVCNTGAGYGPFDPIVGCSQCLPGYLHNVVNGNELICDPKTCGSSIAPFSATLCTAGPCNQRGITGNAANCLCERGYTGRYCEACMPGYLAEGVSSGVAGSCIAATSSLSNVSKAVCYGHGSANYLVKSGMMFLPKLGDILPTDTLENTNVPLGLRQACDCYGDLTPPGPEFAISYDTPQSVGLSKRYYSGRFCEYPPLQAFVTSASYQGDFGKVLAGARGVDGLCQDAALSAGLKGRWAAWISDSQSTATGRMPNRYSKIINLVSSGGAATFVGSLLVAENLTELAAGNWRTSLQTNEFGYVDNRNLQGRWIWTGTQVGGASDLSFNCQNWQSSSASFSGSVGLTTGVLANWMHAKSLACKQTAGLYCLENRAPCGYGQQASLRGSFNLCSTNSDINQQQTICNYSGDPCIVQAGGGLLNTTLTCSPKGGLINVDSTELVCVSGNLSPAMWNNPQLITCPPGQVGAFCEFCDQANHYMNAGNGTCICAPGYTYNYQDSTITCNKCAPGYLNVGTTGKDVVCLKAEVVQGSICNGNPCCGAGYANQDNLDVNQVNLQSGTVGFKKVCDCFYNYGGDYCERCNAGYTGLICDKCSAGYLNVGDLLNGVRCSSLTCGTGANPGIPAPCNSGVGIQATTPCHGRGGVNTALGGGVETSCTCNPGYAGTYCQNCNQSYLASAVSGGVAVSCVTPIQNCSGHALNGLLPNSGANGGQEVTCTCNTAQGYTGVICNRCLNYYAYSASQAGDMTCFPETSYCYSGRGGVTQVTSASNLATWGQNTSCTCNSGYTGKRCEYCAANYRNTSTALTPSAPVESCVDASLPLGCAGLGKVNTGIVDIGYTGGVANICTCDAGALGPTCSNCAQLYRYDPTTGKCILTNCDVATNKQVTKTINSGPLGGLETSCACSPGYSGVDCSRCASHHLAVYSGASLNCYFDKYACNYNGVANTGVNGGLGTQCVCNSTTYSAAAPNNTKGHMGTNCENCSSNYAYSLVTNPAGDLAGSYAQCTAYDCYGHGSINTGANGGTASVCSCNSGYGGGNCDQCGANFLKKPTSPLGSGLLCETDFDCSRNGSSYGHGFNSNSVQPGLATACTCYSKFAGRYCENCNSGYLLSYGVCLDDEQCNLAGTNPNNVVGGGLSTACTCTPLGSGTTCRYCVNNAVRQQVGYFDGPGSFVSTGFTCSCMRPWQATPPGASRQTCSTCAAGYTGTVAGACDRCQANYSYSWSAYTDVIGTPLYSSVLCTPYTCQHGGTINSAAGGGAAAVCSCPGNYTGNQCENCAPGYTGTNCGQCMNGYMYVLSGSSWSCVSAIYPSVGGKVCNGHGTINVNSGTETKCTCEAGYTGTLCDQCTNGIMQNGQCVACDQVSNYGYRRAGIGCGSCAIGFVNSDLNGYGGGETSGGICDHCLNHYACVRDATGTSCAGCIPCQNGSKLEQYTNKSGLLTNCDCARSGTVIGAGQFCQNCVNTICKNLTPLSINTGGGVKAIGVCTGVPNNCDPCSLNCDKCSTNSIDNNIELDPTRTAYEQMLCHPSWTCVRLAKTVACQYEMAMPGGSWYLLPVNKDFFLKCKDLNNGSCFLYNSYTGETGDFYDPLITHTCDSFVPCGPEFSSK